MESFPTHTALLGVPETMRRLGLGKTKTYELMRSGELESVVVGRRRLVPSDAIEALVARLREASGGQRERGRLPRATASGTQYRAAAGEE